MSLFMIKYENIKVINYVKIFIKKKEGMVNIFWIHFYMELGIHSSLIIMKNKMIWVKLCGDIYISQ